MYNVKVIKYPLGWQVRVYNTTVGYSKFRLNLIYIILFSMSSWFCVFNNPEEHGYSSSPRFFFSSARISMDQSMMLYFALCAL